MSHNNPIRTAMMELWIAVDAILEAAGHAPAGFKEISIAFEYKSTPEIAARDIVLDRG